MNPWGMGNRCCGSQYLSAQRRGCAAATEFLGCDGVTRYTNKNGNGEIKSQVLIITGSGHLRILRSLGMKSSCLDLGVLLCLLPGQSGKLPDPAPSRPFSYLHYPYPLNILVAMNCTHSFRALGYGDCDFTSGSPILSFNNPLSIYLPCRCVASVVCFCLKINAGALIELHYLTCNIC